MFTGSGPNNEPSERRATRDSGATFCYPPTWTSGATSAVTIEVLPGTDIGILLSALLQLCENL